MGNGARFPLNPASWGLPTPALTYGWEEVAKSAVGKLGALEEWPSFGMESAAGMTAFNSVCTRMLPICQKAEDVL